MKSKINKIKIAGLLSFAVFCGSLNFDASATAQETGHPKVAEKPTPTPKQTSNPKPTIAPTLFPTPTPLPTATPAPVPVQTISDLQSRIRLTLSRPELRRGSVGVKIVSLDTNKVIFEENAEKYFMPASNMKSYTVAAAMEKLSPDFRFVTSVYAPAMPDANGVIRGDLSIYGRGDVSFSTAFYDGDYYKGLDALAAKIVQAGVKRIEGNLVGDESYFTGNPIPPSWEWEDLQWYYGAEISALPVNDNAVDLSVKPNSINLPCAVQVLPANAVMKIVNRCTTSANGAKREIQIVKKIDQNTIEINGTMPLEDKGYKGFIAVSRPAQLFVELLRGLLIQKGVVITGQNKVINTKGKAVSAVASSVPPVEITKLESPPFSLVAAKTMKPSQNTYTETILWTLGEQIGRKQESPVAADEISIKKLQQTSSADLGLKVVQVFMSEIGVAPDSVIQWDGSGLSRHNLVTPSSAVQLYTYMSKSRYAGAWRNSLTIGAMDGTLKSRFRETAAAANVRGKTGTIDQVSALSGYVMTASGERLVFSILVNGVNDVRLRQAAIDEIVVALANFNGKTN
ncbi:MAG: D-alanyl-D-alanine carboxypeptidase/D-alanyl-D-alanine-endopeptidase [Acidobacteria bacterium]|nr:D-alanyl-D-alanine carboxypeptidase/D-alanyl-D-alanine-endopeptidase [Acidobacteriota bacterium]